MSAYSERWRRELDRLPGGFDGVVNMWASFGYFDAAENERVLGSFARRLRPGGRLVLDLFNRAFFERIEAEAEPEREASPEEPSLRLVLELAPRPEGGHRRARRPP